MGDLSSLLDVIEAAYAVDQSEMDWLRGLHAAAAPFFAGIGRLSYLYDASCRPLKLWNMVGSLPMSLDEVVASLAGADDDYIEHSFLSVPYGTASEVPGFARQRGFLEHLAPYGARDALLMNALGPDGLGVALGCLLAEPRRPSPLERQTWSRVASHVVAGMRLRARLHAASAGPANEPEAVLATTGRAEHLSAAARGEVDRDALRTAVLSMERARGALRTRDPDAAVATWRVLVRGRWSLVDHFERGGKRYLVAHANAPRLDAPPALTPREQLVLSHVVLGHAPKLIAYELGVSASTVRVHLANARVKLGARSREELIRQYRHWKTHRVGPADRV